ncbi:MAG: ABC-2 type transport system permease protein [Planctomycetota bacterium]|jgi:ABC-2 type transport system permease protein
MLRLEALRLWRSRRPLVALFAVAFFIALMTLGFYTYAQARTSGKADFHFTFENRSYFNGLTFTLYSFYFGSVLILPIFAATEGGVQLAGDTASGVLKLFLTRPLSRSRIFFSKAVLGCGACAVLAGFLLGASLLVGLLFIGWGDITLYPGVLQMTASQQHLAESEALQRFLMAWPAATLSLIVPYSMSLLISSWSKSPVNAVGCAVSLYLVMYVISEIHFFESLRPWLFTSDTACWRDLFQADVDWPSFLRKEVRLAGFALVFFALAFRRFRLREELV